jgi:diguanylate cyclase (GGDEF)-like protein
MRNALDIDLLLRAPGHRSWTALALLAIVLVGIIDYATGPEFTFSLFYLIPVAAAAWLAGTAIALAASVLAAVVWLLAELFGSRVDSNMIVYGWNFTTRLLFLLLVAMLLASLRVMLVRERTLSRTDPLTGMLNARAMREIADAELSRAERYRHPLSLAFIDVDDFKRLNDSRGHTAGDRLLKRIAELIKSNLRASDFVARYGGDEFVVLLPLADEGAARNAVGKLQARVAASDVDGVRVTLSVGVITYVPGPGTASIDTLLENADRLMYEVKTKGKANARFARLG